MAYINKETSAKIRKALKVELGKDFTISVKIRDHSVLNVTLVKGKTDFSSILNDRGYAEFSRHHLDDYGEHSELLKKIDKTIRTVGNWYDKSDIMTDYFCTAFYYYIHIGSWDKPYQQIA